MEKKISKHDFSMIAIVLTLVVFIIAGLMI